MSNNNGRRPPHLHAAAFDKNGHHQASSHIGHTSPPDTPAISRVVNHSSPTRNRPPPVPDRNIRPVGNGHHFSYQPFELLSPHPSPPSSSSSLASDDDDGDDPSVDNCSADANGGRARQQPDSESKSLSDEGSESNSDTSSASFEDAGSSRPTRQGSQSAEQYSGYVGARFTSIAATGGFVIEEVDPMDSENDGLETLQPTEIESNRSRSRSRQRELPRRIIRDMRNLNCDTETSSEEEDEGTEEAFDKRQKQLYHRRISFTSSIGKRTYSERSSDSGGSDNEGLDVNDVGSSARHLRKRMHRGSLLFQDPPEPRIDELEEPDSSEDELLAGQSLAQELPYWTLEIMEMEDSA